MVIRSAIGILALLAMQSFSISEDVESDGKQTRLGFLLDRADKLKFELQLPGGSIGKVDRVAEPVLKFQNPLYEAQSDGVLLIWVHGGVPVAFGSYSIRHERNVFRELATVADEAMRCTVDGNAVWSPTPGFQRRPIESSQPVPDNERLRLRVMKRLVVGFQSGKKRILPTPVYRYRSDSKGIIDGAVFVLSDTNDPEILVVVEAIQGVESGKASWRYTLGRMNSQPQQVHFADQQVWDLKGYWNNPKSIA